MSHEVKSTKNAPYVALQCTRDPLRLVQRSASNFTGTHTFRPKHSKAHITAVDGKNNSGKSFFLGRTLSYATNINLVRTYPEKYVKDHIIGEFYEHIEAGRKVVFSNWNR